MADKKHLSDGRRVAVIGVGAIGMPIALRLNECGYDVRACDRDPRREAYAREKGLHSTHSAPSAAEGVDAIFLSLPNATALEEVMLGPDGLIEAIPRGSLLIDLSTSPPDLTRRIAARASARDIDFLDAPVSGGVARAAVGQLTIMVGGTQTAFGRASAMLETIGASIFHLGPTGSGQICKLINNLMSAANLAVIAEGLTLGKREGLDLQKLCEVIRVSSGGSRRFDDSAPRILEGSFRLGHGNLELFVKDLGEALRLAKAHQLSLPVTEESFRQYAFAQSRGFGELDIEAIMKIYDN